MIYNKKDVFWYLLSHPRRCELLVSRFTPPNSLHSSFAHIWPFEHIREHIFNHKCCSLWRDAFFNNILFTASSTLVEMVSCLKLFLSVLHIECIVKLYCLVREYKFPSHLWIHQVVTHKIFNTVEFTWNFP